MPPRVQTRVLQRCHCRFSGLINTEHNSVNVSVNMSDDTPHPHTRIHTQIDHSA